MMAYDEEDEDEENLKKEAKLEAYLAKKANPAKDKGSGLNRKQRRAKEAEERKFDNDFKKINQLVEKRKDGTIDENAFSIIVPGIWDADTQKILPERRLDLYAESKSEREAWAKALKVHLSPRR